MWREMRFRSALTWPHSTRLSDRRTPPRAADGPHVSPQYKHGSFGLSHEGSHPVVRLDDCAHQIRVSSAGTSGPEKRCWYCEPNVARDAVSQRPDVAALDAPVGRKHAAAGRPTGRAGAR